MLTKTNKNVIIESVDKRQQDLRKSEFGWKKYFKKNFKKVLTRYYKRQYNTKAVEEIAKYIEK